MGGKPKQFRSERGIFSVMHLLENSKIPLRRARDECRTCSMLWEAAEMEPDLEKGCRRQETRYASNQLTVWSFEILRHPIWHKILTCPSETW